MVSEIVINRLENVLTEVIDFSGTKEQTKIVSNMEVVNASPAGLTGFVTIKDNRDGDTILATTIPGVTYTAGDLVNVLFIDGTEPIAFQQASASATTNGLWQLEGGTGPGIFYNDGSVGIKETTPVTSLEVTTTTASDGGIFGAAYAGNYTSDAFAAFAHVDNRAAIATDYALLQSDTGDTFFNAQGARSIIFRQANTNEFMSMDTAEVVINDSGIDRNFRIEGDTEANLFFVDAGNDRVGIGTNSPATLLHVFSPDTSAIARLETDQVNGVARFELLNDVKQWNIGVNSSDAITFFDANTGFSPLVLDPNPTKSFMVRINVNEVVVNDNGADADFRVESDGDTHNIFSEGGTDRVGIGENVPLAKLHVDQASTTAAIPVVYWDQADVSEEFVKLVGTAAAATLTQSFVDEGDVTTATRIGWYKINIDDIGNQITDGDYWVPFFSLA